MHHSVRHTRIVFLCISFLILVFGSFRFSPSVPAENSSFTLLIYMAGSDLESEDGAASADIAEILAACPGDSLHILIQTGGSAVWHREGIEAGAPQRFMVHGNELVLMETLDPCPMSSAKTLSDFLSWGIGAAPAARYAAVLWNHGGGTLLGYGFDEYYPGESISVADLHTVFSELNIRFSFIGFDACMMAGLETARALSGYADYLIASEEREPVTGWYYTGWLRMLSEDPSADILRLGDRIIRDFVSERNAGPYDPCTLSMIDLDRIPGLCEDLGAWFSEGLARSESDLPDLARQREKIRSVGSGSYDQIDLIGFLKNAAVSGCFPGTASLISEAERSIIFSAHNRAAAAACGLSVYYPYLHPEHYGPAAKAMERSGFSSGYFGYFNSFVSHIEKGRSSVPLEDALADIRILADGSIDPDCGCKTELIADCRLMQLCLSDRGYVLAGTYDPGNNGSGSSCGRSKACFLTIGGRPVSYEADRRTGGTSGYTTARLNGSRYVRLQLEEDPNGAGLIVAGYLEVPEPVAAEHADILAVPSRGLRSLKPGDRLEFGFDCYRIIRHRPVFDGIVFLGRPLVCGGQLSADLSEDPSPYFSPAGDMISSDGLVYLENSSALPFFMITDIYGRTICIRAADAWDPSLLVRFDKRDRISDTGGKILNIKEAGAPEDDLSSDAPEKTSVSMQGSYSVILPR